MSGDKPISIELGADAIDIRHQFGLTRVGNTDGTVAHDDPRIGEVLHIRGVG